MTPDADHYRAAIAARDGAIGAFLRLAPPVPHGDGPLAGLPVAVKDLIDTAGLGTEYGSPVFAGHVPARDAACVAKLKAAGAVILGKTVTTEFAHMTPRGTVNPHDPRRTPGGSSSGSAAAVAAGMAPVALGTQTGGSVIRPASYCGVHGFKSTAGRTDVTGVHELAGSMDTIGWMAADAELLHRLGPVLVEGWRDPGTGPFRLARAETPFDHLAEPAMLAACDRLADRLGAPRISLPAAFAEALPLHRRMITVEAARAFDAYERRCPELLSPALREFIALGRANAPGYAAAVAAAEALRAAFTAFMAPWDGLILPAATGEAPLGLDFTGDATFSLWTSALQLPCISIPGAVGANGMPLGVQVVGAKGGDEKLLAIARMIG